MIQIQQNVYKVVVQENMVMLLIHLNKYVLLATHNVFLVQVVLRIVTYVRT